MLRECSSPTTFHMSPVRCHMSHVMCNMSHFFYKGCEAYQWGVCYQRGPPRLVFFPTSAKAALNQNSLKKENYIYFGEKNIFPSLHYKTI